jgi:ABC-2 type transport system ATP-binding protein
VIELAELGKLENRLVVELSKGMKQRLQVARILLHDPKVLVLDEPASDLDPRARIEVRDLLLELRDLGKTIFLSSHILTELSDICTSVGILERGQLVVTGPIAEIGERLALREREAGVRSETAFASGTALAPPVVAEGAPSVTETPGGVIVPAAARKRLRLRVLGDSRLYAPLLVGGSGVLGVEPGPGGQLLVTYMGDDRFVAEVVRHLVAHGVGVVSVEPERNELERIFLEVTRGELS